MKILFRILVVVMLCIATVACEDFFTTSDAPQVEGEQSVASEDGAPVTTSVSDGTVPFSWGSVNWCSGDGNVGGWDVTVGISGASVGGGVVSWTYSTPPGNWAQSTSIKKSPNACLGFVTKVNGQWCGAIGEWVTPGLTSQATKAFSSGRDGSQLFSGPLAGWSPSTGTEMWIFICGLNWHGQSNVKERSNAYPIVFQ